MGCWSSPDWKLDYLLRQRRLGLPAAGRGLVLLTWFALYFIVDWQGDTGQREHLFVLLYIPYLFLRILRYRGGLIAAWFAVLLGVQAGIGAELKPLFLLIAVNVEIVLLIATHRRRMLFYPEVVALAGVVIAYTVHWMLVPTAMREAFFSRWLPLISYGYNADDVSYLQVIEKIMLSPVSLAALAAAVAAVMVCMQRRSRLRFHLIALATLTAVTFVLIILQQKGWTSHCIPLNVAGMLCLAILVVEGTRMWTIGRRTSAVGVGQWAVGGAIFARGRDRVVRRARYDRAGPARSRRAPPGRRAVLGSNRPGARRRDDRPTRPIRCCCRWGRRPGSRYLYSFPIRCVYAEAAQPTNNPSLYRRGQDSPIEERQFLTELDDDVMRKQPRLIVIQDRSKLVGLPEDFNTFDYLRYCGWTDKSLMLPLPRACGARRLEGVRTTHRRITVPGRKRQSPRSPLAIPAGRCPRRRRGSARTPTALGKRLLRLRSPRNVSRRPERPRDRPASRRGRAARGS